MGWDANDPEYAAWKQRCDQYAINHPQQATHLLKAIFKKRRDVRQQQLSRRAKKLCSTAK